MRSNGAAEMISAPPCPPSSTTGRGPLRPAAAIPKNRHNRYGFAVLALPGAAMELPLGRRPLLADARLSRRESDIRSPRCGRKGEIRRLG